MVVTHEILHNLCLAKTLNPKHPEPLPPLPCMHQAPGTRHLHKTLIAVALHAHMFLSYVKHDHVVSSVTGEMFFTYSAAHGTHFGQPRVLHSQRVEEFKIWAASLGEALVPPLHGPKCLTLWHQSTPAHSYKALVGSAWSSCFQGPNPPCRQAWAFQTWLGQPGLLF